MWHFYYLSPPICAAKENYNRPPLITTKADYELLLIFLLTMLANSTYLGHDHGESLHSKRTVHRTEETQMQH